MAGMLEKPLPEAGPRPIRVAVLLGVILLSFSFPAFHGLRDQGLLYHDNGTNILEALFVQEGLDVLAGRMGEGVGQEGFLEQIKSRTNGVPPITGKPAYTAVLWLAGLGLGFGEALPPVVTAWFSLLGILLTFFVGKRLYGTASALYGSAILAASTMYLVYARGGLSDGVATACFLAAFLFYLRAPRGGAGLSNLLAGVAFGLLVGLVHLRGAHLAVFVMALDALVAWKGRWGLRVFLRRSALLATGFAGVLLLFQLPYLLGEAWLGPLPFRSYWDILSWRTGVMNHVSWFHDITEMTRTFWAVDSALVFCLIAAGWCLLLWRAARQFGSADVAVLLLSLVPFALASAMTLQLETLPRTVSAAIPLAAIAGGELLACAQRRLAGRWQALSMARLWPTVIVLAVVLAMGVGHSLAMGITRSGYRQASQWLAQTGDEKFMLLGMEPIWRVHLGRAAYKPYERPQSIEELIAASEAAGIRYVVADVSTFNSKHGVGYTRRLAQGTPPDAVFDNPLGVSLPYLVDTYGLHVSAPISQDPLNDKIYVFSVTKIKERFL